MNIRRRLLKEITGTFIENHGCFFIIKKYTTSNKLAGIRKRWDPRNEKTCMRFVLTSDTYFSRKLKTLKSRSSRFFKNTILAIKIKAARAAKKATKTISTSRLRKLTLAQNSFIPFLKYLIIL
jgi:hypothetical protein